MRASFGAAFVAFGALGVLGAFGGAACTYKTDQGQGGDLGTIALWEGDGSIPINTGSSGGSSSGGFGQGSGSGGGTSSGTSSGAPSGSGSGGTSSGGSSSGVIIGGDDAGLPPPPPPDSSTGCAPPPTFPNDCQVFFRAQDAGATCSSCVQAQGCSPPACISGPSGNGCASKCGTMPTAAQFCSCMAQCAQSSPDACCFQETDKYFACYSSPQCGPFCP